MKRFSIPISLLRQFCFCPRIPYFSMGMQLKVESPLWVKQGVKAHDRQQMLYKRRNLTKFGIESQDYSLRHNVYLQSDTLFLHGVCDSILSTKDNDYIIEFKNVERKHINFAEKIQLTAYALVYEDMFNGSKISKGFILLGNRGKTFSIDIDQELRHKTLLIRDHIFENFEKGAIPKSSATEGKCCQCEYFNFCADRF